MAGFDFAQANLGTKTENSYPQPILAYHLQFDKTVEDFMKQLWPSMMRAPMLRARYSNVMKPFASYVDNASFESYLDSIINTDFIKDYNASLMAKILLDPYPMLPPPISSDALKAPSVALEFKKALERWLPVETEFSDDPDNNALLFMREGRVRNKERDEEERTEQVRDRSRSPIRTKNIKKYS